jgi:thiol-disulfide isomerase/thioredoxin
MNKSNNDAASRERGSFGFAWILIGLAIVVYFAMRSGGRPAAGQFVGIPRPPLSVGGWLNADTPPSDESLRGRVVLIDCWFADCPPCRASMPHLVEFYNRYRDQGLVLIGLTPDAGRELAAAEAFVESIPGFDWPVGYDAQVPLGMMGVYEYPTLILFDASGRSVWAGHRVEDLGDAVDKALAGTGQESRVKSREPDKLVNARH